MDAIALDFDGTVVETARERAKELGIDPFEIMLKFAAGDYVGLGMSEDEKEQNAITPSMRLAAAIEATQYIHPKRRSTELSMPPKTGEMEAVTMPPVARRERIMRLRGFIDVTPSSTEEKS